MEEGVDGGIRALRHTVVVATYRSKMEDAKNVLRSLRFAVTNRQDFVRCVARAVSASGLVTSEVTPLNALFYWAQYADGTIDTTAEGVVPSEFA